MQTLRLDISNDIYDKVIFFLQNLPQNKIKLSVEKKIPNEHFNPKDFWGVANCSKDEIDSYLTSSKNEWESTLYE